MKKIISLTTLLIAGMLTCQAAIADPTPNFVVCSWGQKCQVPIDQYGNVGTAEYNIPGPYADPIGKFTCTISSSNPAIKMDINSGIEQSGYAPNSPVIVQGNPIPILPVSFVLGWSQPGKPHPGIGMIILTTGQVTPTQVDPSTTQIFVTCNPQ